MNDNELSVVMPVFNEEECIQDVISSWHEQLSLMEISFKIIVVNDSSTDITLIKLVELQKKVDFEIITNDKNEGHGISLTKAYKVAIERAAPWIFHVDSDNQFLPKDFSKLWDQRTNANFLIGTREDRKDGIIRFIVTKILLTTIFVIFGIFIKDSNSPYRLMKTTFLKQALDLIPSKTFTPNIFLSIIAKKSLPIIIETPVTHLERKTGSSTIIKWGLIKACLLAFKQLITLRFNIIKLL